MKGFSFGKNTSGEDSIVIALAASGGSGDIDTATATDQLVSSFNTGSKRLKTTSATLTSAGDLGVKDIVSTGNISGTSISSTNYVKGSAFNNTTNDAGIQISTGPAAGITLATSNYQGAVDAVLKLSTSGLIEKSTATMNTVGDLKCQSVTATGGDIEVVIGNKFIGDSLRLKGAGAGPLKIFNQYGAGAGQSVGLSIANNSAGTASLTGGDYTSLYPNPGVVTASNSGALKKSTVLISSAGALTCQSVTATDYTSNGYFKGRYHVGSDSVHGLDLASSTQLLNAEFKGLQDSVITVSNNGDLRRTAATITSTGDLSCKSIASTDNDVWSGKPQLNLIVGSAPNTTATGANNILIGQAAGAALTTGSNNIFIGHQADTTVPIMSNQITIGFGAVCGGQDTICLGNAAITVIRSNSDNYCNLGASNKRFSNVFTNNLNCVGVQTATNVLIGSTFNTTVTGADNVLIGQGAGAALTSGNNNIFIGNQGNTSVPDSNNMIAIGTAAFCDASNQICLGNASITEIRNNSDNLCSIGSASKRFSNVFTNAIKSNTWLSATNTVGIQLADTTACPITLTGSAYNATQDGKVLSLLNGVITPIAAPVGGSVLSGTFTEFRVKQPSQTESNVSLYVIKVGKIVTISIPAQTPAFQASSDMYSYICSHTDLQPAHSSGVTNGTTTVQWAGTTGAFYLKHSSSINWPVGSIVPLTFSYESTTLTLPSTGVWGTVYPAVAVSAPTLVTPTLTTNTSNPNFLVSASSEFSASYPTWHIFDNSNNSWSSLGGRYGGDGVATTADTFTYSGGTTNGAWVRVSMDQTYKFNYYKLGQNSGTDENPVDFTLYGSDSVADNTFISISSPTGYSLVGTNGVFNPNINVGTQQFRYLVFQVHKTSGATGICNLREMAFGWV